MISARLMVNGEFIKAEEVMVGVGTNANNNARGVLWKVQDLPLVVLGKLRDDVQKLK